MGALFHFTLLHFIHCLRILSSVFSVVLVWVIDMLLIIVSLRNRTTLALACVGRCGHLALPGGTYVCEILKVVLLPSVEAIHVHHRHSLLDSLLQEHLIDIPRVICRGDSRLERRFDLPLQEQLPIDLFEPGVPLNVRGIPNALLGVPV